MKLRTLALACLLVTASTSACSNDPTAAGSGEPEVIVATRSLTNVAIGAKTSITAYTLDKNAQRMAGALTATSNGAALVIDSVVYVHELLETRVFFNPVSKTASAGVSFTISGHGLTKDVTVVIS
jgi:hypothetical protein